MPFSELWRQGLLKRWRWLVKTSKQPRAGVNAAFSLIHRDTTVIQFKSIQQILRENLLCVKQCGNDWTRQNWLISLVHPIPGGSREFFRSKLSSVPAQRTKGQRKAPVMKKNRLTGDSWYSAHGNKQMVSHCLLRFDKLSCEAEKPSAKLLYLRREKGQPITETRGSELQNWWIFQHAQRVAV